MTDENKGSIPANRFTHFDIEGRPVMVDVSDKMDTRRTAIAACNVRMSSATRTQIENGRIHKGDVFQVAELAGIMATKRTAELIPLCHSLPITAVTVTCSWIEADGVRPAAHAVTLADATQTGTGTGTGTSAGAADTAILEIRASVTTTYKTGVEMEAMTACTIAGLTVYDMCKAVDRGMVMENVRLVHKSGGKSGTWNRDVEN